MFYPNEIVSPVINANRDMNFFLTQMKSDQGHHVVEAGNSG